MTFKQQLKESFIPRIKEMIKKEEEHLEYLKDSKEKIYISFNLSILPTTFNPINTSNIDFMIKQSNEMLEHLKTRLKEYIEYSEKD